MAAGSTEPNTVSPDISVLRLPTLTCIECAAACREQRGQRTDRTAAMDAAGPIEHKPGRCGGDRASMRPAKATGHLPWP
jgi:hypothetical protein